MINQFARIVFLFCILVFEPGLSQENTDQEQVEISAKQLVVMIDGRFPTTDVLTSGAGVVVGKKDGFVYIATAGHVVRGFSEIASDIEVQFLDRPGDVIKATLWPAEFDKGVDVAILVVPEERVPSIIKDSTKFPAARLKTELVEGEGAYLIGQPEGLLWSGNKIPEKVVTIATTYIEIESNSVVPGFSGGVALDEVHRIVGLIIESKNGVARALTLKYLKDLIERSSFPFDIVDSNDVVVNVVASGISLKDRLTDALLSGDSTSLIRISPDKKVAKLTQSILTGDKLVRDAFFKNIVHPESIVWLKELVTNGFNPNFIVNNGRSAHYYALLNNNVPLSIALLEGGASPHAYQSLWGNETKIVSVLHPLEWLSLISASNDEKKQIALAMANAGLAVPVISPSGGYGFDYPDITANAQTLDYFGIVPETVNAIERDDVRCDIESELTGIDWCAEMREVPAYIENITGAGSAFDDGFLIGKLLSVYDNRMYFAALSFGGHYIGYPLALAVISRGRDRVQIYRYGRNAAGLGHCSRLRDRAAGRPLGGYIDADDNASCWRRVGLSRKIGQSGYDYYWKQSYYCRNGDLYTGGVQPLKYSGTWAEVPESRRMSGRVPC